MDSSLEFLVLSLSCTIALMIMSSLRVRGDNAHSVLYKHFFFFISRCHELYYYDFRRCICANIMCDMVLLHTFKLVSHFFVECDRWLSPRIVFVFCDWISRPDEQHVVVGRHTCCQHSGLVRVFAALLELERYTAERNVGNVCNCSRHYVFDRNTRFVHDHQYDALDKYARVPLHE